MIDKMIKSSQQHLQGVEETYWQHWCYAFVTACKLFGAATALFVHGIIPYFFKTTASSSIAKIDANITARAVKNANMGLSREKVNE